MKIVRFSTMGVGWENLARARYPGLFRVMTVQAIRTQYGMRTNADGSAPRTAGDAVWLGVAQDKTAIAA